MEKDFSEKDIKAIFEGKEVQASSYESLDSHEQTKPQQVASDNAG